MHSLIFLNQIDSLVTICVVENPNSLLSVEENPKASLLKQSVLCMPYRWPIRHLAYTWREATIALWVCFNVSMVIPTQDLVYGHSTNELCKTYSRQGIKKRTKRKAQRNQAFTVTKGIYNPDTFGQIQKETQVESVKELQVYTIKINLVGTFTFSSGNNATFNEFSATVYLRPLVVVWVKSTLPHTVHSNLSRHWKLRKNGTYSVEQYYVV